MTSRELKNGRWALILTPAVLWGCTGETSTERPGTEPPPIVVRTDPASAAQCPDGGSVVSSGPDSNGNGALDDVEIATRAVVCMPASTTPPGSVLRLVAEPPGVNCGAGGTAVQSGSDVNQNGRLDDAEVAHTEYACGDVLLTRLADEPPGANCTAGGVAFFAGRDRNADHILDQAEVEVTEYDCGDTLSRDVDILSADDVAALANIRTITGDLTIGLVTLDVVSLPRLEHVGGALTVIPIHLNQLSLPELRDIDGPLALYGKSAVVDFSRLVRVGALAVHTGGLGGLGDLSALSALAVVDRDVEIRDAFGLTSVELTDLAIGGDLEISNNRQLTKVAITMRDRVDFVSITSNAALEEVSLSVVPRSDATSRMGGVDVFTNGKLTHLSLAADRVSDFLVGDNPSIADLALDVAGFDGDVLIFDITTAFRLALSAPRGAAQVEFGGELAISSALETLVSSVPVIVDDLLVFDKTRLRALDAGARVAAARGGVRFSDNARLTDIAPFTLGGGLQLINNAVLPSVPVLPLLDPSAFEGAVISDNPMLASVPSLAQVERVRFSIDVERNPRLGQLPVPALHWIYGDLTVAENAILTSLDLPVLEHAAALDINRNPALQTLEAPALVDAQDQLFIFQNLKLRHIVFDSLTSSGLFEVFGNPKLPSCEVLGIFAHVSGFHHQSGNDDTAPCGS